MSRVIVIESDLLTSQAFKAISRAHSIRVLMEFLRRRKIHKTRDRKGVRGNVIISNNGELVFTYRDGMQRLGVSQATFSRCLSELIAVGFLDIAELSSGLHRQPTKFALSNRWRQFGTPDFQHVQRAAIIPPFAKQKKSQLSELNTK